MPSLALRLACALVLVGAARSADAASLVLSSGSLQLETAAGSGATATLSMAGGNIVITSSEVIGLGGVPGWSGDGTTTVSGPASVMTGGFFALAFARVTFASDFTTPGALTINPPVSISTSVHLTAGSGITLAALDSTIDGSYDFTAEVTGAGNLIFAGSVGAVARPASLSLSVGSGSFIEPAAAMSCSGAQLYLGTVGLQSATSLTGSPITLGDVVAFGSGVLTLHGDSTIDGSLGNAAASLTSVTVSPGTTTFNGGSVHTSGLQSYGNIVLAADTALVGTEVHLFGGVDGAHHFTLTADAFFSGSLGATTPLAALDVSGATTVTNAANSIAVVTVGDQHYAGVVSLAADVGWSGANITHDSTIDGAHALTITATTRYHAGGAIGSVTPLTALAVHGPATWAGGTLTTTASVHFFDALALAVGFTVASPQVIFDGAVDGADPLTATGTTTFGGAVGATTPLAALTVNGATHLLDTSVANIGAQQYLGPLVVSAASTALSTGSFAITFGGAIDRAGGGPLSIATTTHTGIVFAGGTTCDFVLAGTTAGSEYTQLVSDGAVTLNDCTLHATSTAPFAAGTQFLVIDGAPVNGTFAGLVQGAHTTIGGQDFTVDYAHGGVRLVAQAGADMAATAPADLASSAPDDLAGGGEGDLGGADLGALPPADAATGGSHGGCAYASDAAAAPGAVASVAWLLLMLLAARRRAPSGRADHDGR